MTTDPALQSLFAASEQTYEDEAFTQQVMKKSRFVRYRLRIILASILLLVISVAIFASADLQTMIIQLNAVMSADILTLDEDIISIILAPVNTIAGLLFIIFKLAHTIYKWARK
jgi:predicted neutral ceramidase superfamily lipid hydrolase